MLFGGLLNEFNYMGIIWDTLNQIVCDFNYNFTKSTFLCNMRYVVYSGILIQTIILSKYNLSSVGTAFVNWKGNRFLLYYGTQCFYRWTKYSESSSEIRSIWHLATSGGVAAGRRDTSLYCCAIRQAPTHPPWKQS